MLNLYKIIKNTKVEGPGNRFCIWVQGCKKHCRGCWAKDTWDFGVGSNYSVNDLFEQIKSQENIEGVTFLGGEPFEQAKELSELAKLIKSIGLSVVCFTGYTLEELKDKNNTDVNNMLNSVDLLIDGVYEEEKFDISRPWVGSSNQNYYFLTDRYTLDEILRYSNKIEARIFEDGKLEINGMGDFNKLKKNIS